jgi:hypothetical protein
MKWKVMWLMSGSEALENKIQGWMTSTGNINKLADAAIRART